MTQTKCILTSPVHESLGVGMVGALLPHVTVPPQAWPAAE